MHSGIVNASDGRELARHARKSLLRKRHRAVAVRRRRRPRARFDGARRRCRGIRRELVESRRQTGQRRERLVRRSRHERRGRARSFVQLVEASGPGRVACGAGTASHGLALRGHEVGRGGNKAVWTAGCFLERSIARRRGGRAGEAAVKHQSGNGRAVKLDARAPAPARTRA